MANDNNNPEFVINIRAVPEQEGFRQAIDAENELARKNADNLREQIALRERNTELLKQEIAQRERLRGLSEEEAFLGTKAEREAGAIAAADFYKKQKQAEAAASPALPPPLPKTASAAPTTEAAKETSAAVTEAASGGAELTAILPAIGAALGGVATAVGVLRKALSTVMEQNPEVAKSWENMTQALSVAWGDAVRSVVGDGDLLKKAMDTVTTALGGTTEAEKELTEAMNTRLASGEKVLDQAGKIEKALKGQAEAIDKLTDANARARTEQEETTKTQNSALKAKLADDRKAIENDPNLSPEEKAAALAANDRASGDLGRAEKRDEIAARRARAEDELEQAKRARQASEELLKKQEARRKQVQDYETAQRQAELDKAAAERAKGGGGATALKAGLALTSPGLVAAGLLGGADDGLTDAQRQELQDKAARSAAKREELRKALPTDYAQTPEGKKAEEEALAKARQAAEDARKREAEAQRKAGIDEEKNKGEEDRVNQDDQRTQQADEERRQKDQEQKREAIAERTASQQAQDEVNRTLKALKEAGRSGNRKAITKAQAAYNQAKAAQSNLSAPNRADDEPADDDIFAYDNDGNPILYSDLTPEERKAAKAEAKQAAAEDGDTGGDNRRRSRRGRSRDEFQRGNGATMAAGPTTSSGPRSGSNRAASSAGATSPFSSGLSMVGTTPGEAGEISRVGPTSGIAPAKNAISEAMDAFSEAMNSLGALAGHMKRSHQGHALAIGEALAAMQTVSITQAMAAKDFRKIKTQVGAVIASENPVAP